MPQETIEQRVKRVVVEQLGVAENRITSEADFIHDLGADSLDQVELVMAFEEEFGFEIADEDAQGLDTVGHVVTYVGTRTAGK